MHLLPPGNLFGCPTTGDGRADQRCERMSDDALDPASSRGLLGFGARQPHTARPRLPSPRWAAPRSFNLVTAVSPAHIDRVTVARW